jgi:hypothetical protein
MNPPIPMSEVELFKTLLADHGVVPFAAQLLRYCHGRDEEYHAHANNEAARRAEAETFYQANRVLQLAPVVAPSLQPPTAEALWLLLRDSRASHPRIPLVFHVRAVARVLGYRRRSSFLEWFHQKYATLPHGSRLYTPGPLDPVPVVPWRVEADPQVRLSHELVSGAPAFNPENTDDHCDRIECLRLMPAHSSVAVEYEFSPLDSLPPLGDPEGGIGPARTRLVGVGSFGGYRAHYSEQYSLMSLAPLPHASVSVLRRQPAVPFTAESAPTIRPFFPLTPNAPRLGTIATLMGLAARSGISVFVLPELSGSEKDLRQAIDRFEQGEMAGVRLFVAGSAHTEDPSGTRQNKLYAGLRFPPPPTSRLGAVQERLAGVIAGTPRHAGGPRRVLRLGHAKFARFTFRERADPLRQRAEQVHEEGIDRGRTVRVHVSRTCTFVLLICLDFLLQATTDLLAALGTNLVIVEVHLHEKSGSRRHRRDWSGVTAWRRFHEARTGRLPRAGASLGRAQRHPVRPIRRVLAPNSPVTRGCCCLPTFREVD